MRHAWSVPMDFAVFLAGMTMGLSLIVAIGAQNAFVLRQGLRDEHVFAVCLTCAASDAALIVLGVTSFGRIAASLPWLDPVMRYGGAAFLIAYGAKSLRSALRSSEALTAGGAAGTGGLFGTLMACLAITWLNPHVYLDTVVLLGTVSTGFRAPASPSPPAPSPGRSSSSSRSATARPGSGRYSPAHRPGGCWRGPSRWSCGRSPSS